MLGRLNPVKAAFICESSVRIRFQRAIYAGSGWLDSHKSVQANGSLGTCRKTLARVPGAVFAEFERFMIRERVTAGLSRAKADGIQLGRRS